MNLKKDLIQTTKIILLALVLATGVGYVFAWTGPTQGPPNGNVSAPINVGTTNQVKDAGLGVNAISVFGDGFLSGNFGIGATSTIYKLEIYGGVTKTTGGLIIETRTDDPTNPETGRMWLRTDL